MGCSGRLSAAMFSRLHLNNKRTLEERAENSRKRHSKRDLSTKIKAHTYPLCDLPKHFKKVWNLSICMSHTVCVFEKHVQFCRICFKIVFFGIYNTKRSWTYFMRFLYFLSYLFFVSTIPKTLWSLTIFFVWWLFRQITKRE